MEAARAEILLNSRSKRKLKVCVLGLGEVGNPTADYVSRKGFETWGYDKSSVAVRNAKNIKATISWNIIPHAKVEVYIICVSTGILGSSRPDMSAIYDVSKKIVSKMSGRPLVSVESTVSMGTCRKIYEDVFNESVDLVHVPHRFWKGNPVKYGVKQLRVIGGIDKKSLERGLNFYGQLGIPLHCVSTIEIAEMSKIAENSYLFLQIAFAEELKMMCDEKSLDFEDLRNACNTKWNLEIYEARDGIGGHCLPKDTRYLISLCKNTNLLKSAIATDDKYRRWIRRKRFNHSS